MGLHQVVLLRNLKKLLARELVFLIKMVLLPPRPTLLLLIQWCVLFHLYQMIAAHFTNVKVHCGICYVYNDNFVNFVLKQSLVC